MKNLIKDYYGNKYGYLLLLPVLLLMMPHKGIIHDARLYVFDILNIARPGILANDFLAVSGTQNQYTLYPYLAAPLFDVLSPWAATSVVFILGQAIWFSGLIALVAKFAEDEKVAFFGLLSALLLPAAYFGFSVLSYGEPFATPRLFVEGLTFWALWCFFRRAYAISGLMVLAALALHPIMGLIAAALIVALLLQESRRWWWIFAAAGVAGIALVTISGLVPLERITATLEGDWLRVVQARASYLYLSEWPLKDWTRIALAVSITVPLAALYSGWRRRLVVAAWMVAGAGLVLSFVGADLLYNVLLSQVQTNRTVWFVYLLGNVGLGVVIGRMYQKSEEDGDAFFFLYLGAWTVAHLLWPVPGLLIGLIASGLAYLRATDKIAGLPSLFRRLVYLLSAIMFVWLLIFRVKFWLLPGNRRDFLPDTDAFMGIAGFTHVELVFVILLVFAAVRLRWRVPAPATKALLVLLTVWSVFVWDRRSDHERGLEGAYAVSALRDQIPQGAQVYWEGDVKGAWYLLRRPSFFSGTQGAGAVFSRALGEEFWRRSRIVHDLDGVDYVDIWRPFASPREFAASRRVDRQLTLDDLTAVCSRAPQLDFMVLTRLVGDAYIATWLPPAHDTVGGVPAIPAELPPTQARFLYRCADFR